MSPKNKNTFRFYLFGVWVSAIAIILLLTLTSSLLSPSIFWPFATLSIGYQFIFIINFINLCLCIYLKRKLLILPFLTFVVGFYTMTGFYRPGIFVKSKKLKEETSFKIMSYNCRLFDFYNWSENKKSRNIIMQMLKDENPHIICFQEFFDSDEIGFRNIKMIDKSLGKYYSHTEFPIVLRKKDRYGMATFSRHPIVRKKVIRNNYSKMNMCLVSDIVIEKDTIRLFNVHLQSVRFNAAEFKFLQNVEEGDANQRIITTKQILKRLRDGFVKRKTQVDAIVEELEKSPYPVVFCGDFNDTPASYAYRQISNHLDDAYRISGTGLSSTYVGPIPFLRIDFIMHQQDLIQSANYRVIRNQISDHYPIVSHIILPTISDSENQ